MNNILFWTKLLPLVKFIFFGDRNNNLTVFGKRPHPNLSDQIKSYPYNTNIFFIKWSFSTLNISTSSFPISFSYINGHNPVNTYLHPFPFQKDNKSFRKTFLYFLLQLDNNIKIFKNFPKELKRKKEGKLQQYLWNVAKFWREL